MVDGRVLIFYVETAVYFILGLVALALEAWAFFDCVRHRSNAFEAVGKRTKTFWLALTGGSLAVGVLSVLGGGSVAPRPLGLFGLGGRGGGLRLPGRRPPRRQGRRPRRQPQYGPVRPLVTGVSRRSPKRWRRHGFPADRQFAQPPTRGAILHRPPAVEQCPAHGRPPLPVTERRQRAASSQARSIACSSVGPFSPGTFRWMRALGRRSAISDGSVKTSEPHRHAQAAAAARHQGQPRRSAGRSRRRSRR